MRNGDLPPEGQRIKREEFERMIHRALRHLYEPVELQLSPLVSILGLDLATDIPNRLRQLLLESITALKPEARAPLDSTSWRIYRVLLFRFEEQSDQEDVAAQMALSPRQVRRLEHSAVVALADYLIKRHRLVIQPEEAKEPVEGHEDASSVDHAQELDWLRRSVPLESANVADLVGSALQTSEGLLKSTGRQVRVEIAPHLPDALGQVTILRQALLNLLIAVARFSPGESIEIEAGHENLRIFIELRADLPGEEEPNPAVDDILDLAGRLLALSGAELSRPDPLKPSGEVQQFRVRALLQTVEPVDVLVIDDNEDSLRLFQRSLEGTRFRFHGEHDPLSALAAAEKSGAKVIVLDIMLPDIDGWEVLGRLRAHPELGSVPVVISTILPHEELARSLGAAGFLRKPVNREMLLDLLSRLVL